MTAPDPVALASALIRCPSVTPEDAGALGVLAAALEPLGFTCRRLRFEAEGTPAIDNLYAWTGSSGPRFCFAGHSDVVPVGDTSAWHSDPFGADVKGGVLYGRGAADMKSAVAAFAAAAGRHLARHPASAISLLITGDEEGPAINGTVKVLGWLKQQNMRIDHCLVGEPTSTARTGDTIKIGRRGSLNAVITVRGTQGHVAYPRLALNPIPALAELVTRIAAHRLDEGSAHFDPSTLAFTSIDTGNAATNVIPAASSARLNIRFNDLHTPDSLLQWLEDECAATAAETGCMVELEPDVSSVSFLTAPGPFTDLIAKAAQSVTGARPLFSTSGGTSDARFIKDVCPVAELGLTNVTMHKVDECVPIAEIEQLALIYEKILDAYFENPPL